MKRENFPLVYILSNGRSGSTLLELLLNTHPDVWTTGELQDIRFQLSREFNPCGCGVPLPECQFWTELLEDLPLREPVNVDYFREDYGRGRVIRWGQLPDILRGTVDPDVSDTCEKFGEINEVYFRRIRERVDEHTGRFPKWCVDNSKDPYRLYWLKSSGYFDLRTIHLVKDPRAFVHSMTKTSDSKFCAGLRMSVRWIVENLLMRFLCRRHFGPDETRLLKYEKLAVNPEQVRSTLFGWLRLTENKINGAGSRLRENHGISGNKMRWKTTDIRLDRSWAENMPKYLRELVWRLTGPLARKLGYSKNSEFYT